MSTITLPSGMVGEVRGLTGKDGRYLTNEKVVRGQEVEDYILSHCWAATVDEGPYRFGNKTPDWGAALVGDRFYTLIAVREETYPGKEYVMRLQCGRFACRKRFEWEIQLATLLAEKTFPLSVEDRAKFQEGNRFEEVIPFTSTKFVFQLQTGANARRMQARIAAKKQGPKKVQDRQNLIVDAVGGLILEIDGTPMKPEAVFDYLEGLPLATIDALLPLMQGHDCGVESSFEVECTHCGGAMEIQLPFDRAFFLPYSAEAPSASDRKKGTEETAAT